MSEQKIFFIYFFLTKAAVGKKQSCEQVLSHAD